MIEEEPEVRTPWISVRVLVIALFMLACFGALGAKLYVEQITRYDKWKLKVKKSSNVTVRLPSVRGEILDRNGIVLVSNRTSKGVDFYLPQIVQGYRAQHGNRVPRNVYRTNIDEMPKDVEVADVVQIVNTTVINRMSELEVSRDYNAAQLERHYRTNAEVPFPYLDDISDDTVARLSESDAMPGVEIALRPVRQYLYGAFASHVLGYVGQPEDINKEPDIKKFDYYQPDVVGRANVEQFCDRFLRGEAGKRVLERTPKGKVSVTELERIPPKPGSNVYLTLDARIQMIVETTLRQSGVGRAAAVVMDPNNGDILAMANIPNYDPNVFIPKISEDSMQAFEDDDTDPLLNRCIQGYLPGSTYKVVTAFAGLHGGISADRRFNCSGSMTYGGRPMKCWIAERGGSHGSLDLAGALKNSCNCYFFQDANQPQVGLDEIEIIGDALGLGKKTGLPLSGDTAGILPGPRWLASKGLLKEAESSGQIANTSIGQGKVLASPVQIASVCSTVANGGISYFPRLVHRVVDSERNDVRGPDGKLVIPAEPQVRSDLHSLGLKTQDIEVVRRGMWKVVNEQGGTGSKARIKGVEVAGKTGTAQFKRKVNGELIKDNRVWFMCFAPYQKPKYVVVVMVEGAKSGGGVAAPIATKILREALALEAGVEPAIAALKPVAGSFEQIEEMPLKEDGTLAKVVAKAFAGTDQRPNDDETSTADQDAPVESRSKSTARPDVQAKADERGRVTAPQKKPNLWQRLFGPRQPKNTTPPPANPGRIR